jgi:hypothetical protein
MLLFFSTTKFFMINRCFLFISLVLTGAAASYYAYQLGKSEHNSTSLNTDNNLICNDYPWVKEAFIQHPACKNWEGKVICSRRSNDEDTWIEMEFTRSSQTCIASFSMGGDFLELTERIRIDDIATQIPPSVMSQLNTECRGSILLTAERETLTDETILFDFDICQPSGLNYHITYDNMGIRVNNRHENDPIDTPCNCDHPHKLGGYQLTKHAESQGAAPHL